MRVAFLTQDLQLSGGVGVVVEHASQLARHHGFDVSIVLTRQQAESDWAFRGLEHLHVVPLADAVSRKYDVALSTWWETADYLFELDAHRYASFVQSLEDRFYLPEEPERTAAALTLDLPVRFVTEARWIARALEALQPGNRALLVRNGIAKDVFVPPPAAPVALHGPLRVLIEGSSQIAFKGVDDALAATAAMREERVVTLVTPDRESDEWDVPPATSGEASGKRDVVRPSSDDERTGKRDVARAAPDRVVRAVPHAEMARLYAEHDVVLKLSRVEGMFGPPLEGFHRGATCVVTPVTGHEEYVRHGVNGMVVDWDDIRGTARTLDLLARDRALLHRLRLGALATAQAWPSWEQAGGFMALALRRIAAEPPPAPRLAGRRLVRDFQANLAVGQRLTIDHTITSTVLKDVREQNAYKLGLWLRGVFLKLTAPARRVRWWLRSRREG